MLYALCANAEKGQKKTNKNTLERKYLKEGDNEPQNELTTKSLMKIKSITSWKRCEQF